ncbi:hypothetical protein V2J09_023004 [Rumex salicifolius]
MGSGKHRWKISIYKSSAASKAEPKKPPEEFICPISESLMADPVIVTSGNTFERACVQACKTLNFTPTLKDGSVPDFSTVIPNLALKSTIVNWANRCLAESPKPVDLTAALKLVRSLMAETRLSEELLLCRVGDNPDPNIGHAESELNRRHARISSDDWGPNSLPVTPLQLSTRPSCFSPETTASSSEIEVSGSGSGDTKEEDEIVAKLRSAQVHEQEEGVVSLRRSTRSSVDSRLCLCTPRVLSTLRFLIISKYTNVQVNAVAALVNLSLEKANKVKIVRSGVVPPLIDVMKGGFAEAQEHACGALFSLALADDNKTAIGVLGALPPLMHMMRSSESERARNDAALALYHLSLVQSNRSKLVKLGSVQSLLGMLKSGHMTGRTLLILCNIGSSTDGRAAMLDAGAVECLVGMLKQGEFESESTRESCIAAVCALSRGGGLRFKVVAKAAGAAEVVRAVVAEGAVSERGKEKGRRLLEALRAREEEEEEEVDWEKLLEAGLPSRSRLGDPTGTNSSGF